MADMRKNYNWLLSVNGILAVIFALTTMFYSSLTLGSMFVYFGLFAIVSGIVMLTGSVLHSRRFSHWGSRVYEGIITLVLGLGILSFQGLTLELFAMATGAWAFVSGINAVYNAYQFSAHKGLNIFHAIASLIFAGLLVSNPTTGIVATSWLVGLYSLIFGSSMITYAATTSIHEMETSEELEREYDELEKQREKEHLEKTKIHIDRKTA